MWDGWAVAVMSLILDLGFGFLSAVGEFVMGKCALLLHRRALRRLSRKRPGIVPHEKNRVL